MVLLWKLLFGIFSFKSVRQILNLWFVFSSEPNNNELTLSNRLISIRSFLKEGTDIPEKPESDCLESDCIRPNQPQWDSTPRSSFSNGGPAFFQLSLFLSRHLQQHQQQSHPGALQLHRTPPTPQALKEGHERRHPPVLVRQHLHHPGEPHGAAGRAVRRPSAQSLDIHLHRQHRAERLADGNRLRGQHLHVWRPHLQAKLSSVVIPWRTFVRSLGGVHIQPALDCSGALRHYDEARPPENRHKDLPNLHYGAALLDNSAHNRIPSAYGLELRLRSKELLHTAAALLQELHLVRPGYILHNASHNRRSLFRHLLPRPQ